MTLGPVLQVLQSVGSKKRAPGTFIITFAHQLPSDPAPKIVKAIITLCI